MAQLRHMLRDDDVNHEEQKQILELGMKFRELLCRRKNGAILN